MEINIIQSIGLTAFLFIIYNYTEVGNFFKRKIDMFLFKREALGQRIFGKIRYALQCPICFSFWLNIIFFLDNLKWHVMFSIVVSATIAKLYVLQNDG